MTQTSEPTTRIVVTSAASEVAAEWHGVSCSVDRTRDGRLAASATDGVPARFRTKPIGKVDFEPNRHHLSELATLVAGLPPGAVVVVRPTVASAPSAMEALRAHPEGLDVWLAGRSLDDLVEWHQRFPDARTVHTTTASSVKGALEPHVAKLRDLGIDGLGLPRMEWSRGHVVMAHRFERAAVMTGVSRPREIADASAVGADLIIVDEESAVRVRSESAETAEGPHPQDTAPDDQIL